VKISVYDIQGAEMMIVLDKNLSSGKHDVSIDLSELSFGLYLVTIQKESGTLELKLQKM
jgi:hypothetical protein